MDAIEIFVNLPDSTDAELIARYLDEVCGDDQDLRREVEALRARDAGESEFMLGPAVGGQPSEPGAIGDYKLLQEIGRGGFGVVYMADQLKPVKRRVALKIIKLGMDTKQVVARFEVERQALAMMDHANIAKVYDAGATVGGRPYFVMELVRGRPITEFCEEQKLGITGRLDLFIDVCGAIQHAHQKGIIHRDLKPSNVIVTIQDDRAVAKVIDFGVAKATQQDLTDKTLFTRFEQFIGTPAYMSPEQSQMGGLDIDTRSDIYSLGVLLYELLTGTTPIDREALATASEEEIRRAIRDDDPPKPSTRQTALRRRGASMGKSGTIASDIDRELDWIVMKALEKDRKRRYETAGNLAADVRRHLNCEPIEAGPVGVGYRIGKLVRRHRAAVLAAAAMLILLVGGVAMSSWQWLRAASSESQLAKERDRARQGESKALRERRFAQHRVAEELFSAGESALAIAHLARLIREEPDNRVAGERLMCALRQRSIPQRLSPPLPESRSRKAISPSGAFLAAPSRSGAGSAFAIYPTHNGESALAEIPVPEGMEPNDVIFNPGDEGQVLLQCVDPSDFQSSAQLWNWREMKPVGEEVRFGALIYLMEISDDGALACAGSKAGGLRVWSTDGMNTVDWRQEFGSIIQTGAFSPDSRLLAIGCESGLVSILDARTGRRIGQPIQHGGPVQDLAFDPAGERLASASSAGNARVWDARHGTPISAPMTHEDQVRFVEFSPDGRTVLTGSVDGGVRVWDSSSGVPVGQRLDMGDVLRAAHFDSSGCRIVAATSQDIQVWSVASSLRIGERASGYAIYDVSFGLGTDRLFASDSSSQMWSIRNEQTRSLNLRHHSSRENHAFYADLVSSGKFSRDGSRVITSGTDGNAHLFDAATGEMVASYRKKDRTQWAELSPDGAVAVVCGVGGAFLWHPDGETVGRQLCEGWIPQAVFCRVKDGEEGWRLATRSTGENAAVQIWDSSNGSQLGDDLSLEPPTAATAAAVYGLLQFSNDGTMLAAISGMNSVRIWSVSGEPSSWRLMQTLQEDARLWSVAWSPDDRRLVTADHVGKVQQWSAKTGKRLNAPLLHSDGLSHAFYSPSGKRIVTAAADGIARVWDVATGQPLGVPMQHGGAAIMCAFSPDSARVVTTSIDGSARIWDAATGLPMSEALMHDGWAHYAEFSPDGRRVVTTANDTTARIWDLPPAPDAPIPSWVPGWAEALVALRIDDDGNVVKVSWDDCQSLEAEARSRAGDDDFYGRTVDWYYSDPRTRPISPFCDYSVVDYVAARLAETDRDGLPLEKSLEDILRIDPGNVEAHAKLAALLLKKNRGGRISRLYRARYLTGLASSLARSEERYSELLEAIDGEIEKMAQQD